MNILLAGGAGYIGRHTAVVLAKYGYRVVLFDNLSNSNFSVARAIGDIVGKCPILEVGDLQDTERIEKILHQYAIDTVIHFAGFKSVSDSVSFPLKYFDNNVGGTLSLLSAMNTTGVKRLIFSSSATVYGRPQYLPLDESHPTSVTNPYGRTKLHIEQMLEDLVASDPAWRVIIMRYFNPVGAHESGLIGEDPIGIPTNLMPYIASVAVGRLPVLQVWGNDYPTPDGTGIRDYIHIMDLAEGHHAAIDGLCRIKRPCEIFNLGVGRGVSVLQMISTFESVSGLRLPYQMSARRNGDVAECWADTTKALQILGWRATRDLTEMCASVWRFAQNNNLKYR